MIRGSSRPGPLGTVTKSEQKARRTRRVGADKPNTVTNLWQKGTGTMVIGVKDTIDPGGIRKSGCFRANLTVVLRLPPPGKK